MLPLLFAYLWSLLTTLSIQRALQPSQLIDPSSNASVYDVQWQQENKTIKVPINSKSPQLWLSFIFRFPSETTKSLLVFQIGEAFLELQPHLSFSDSNEQWTGLLINTAEAQMIACVFPSKENCSEKASVALNLEIALLSIKTEADLVSAVALELPLDIQITNENLALLKMSFPIQSIYSIDFTTPLDQFYIDQFKFSLDNEALPVAVKGTSPNADGSDPVVAFFSIDIYGVALGRYSCATLNKEKRFGSIKRHSSLSFGLLLNELDPNDHGHIYPLIESSIRISENELKSMRVNYRKLQSSERELSFEFLNAPSCQKVTKKINKTNSRGSFVIFLRFFNLETGFFVSIWDISSPQVIPEMIPVCDVSDFFEREASVSFGSCSGDQVYFAENHFEVFLEKAFIVFGGGAPSNSSVLGPSSKWVMLPSSQKSAWRDFGLSGGTNTLKKCEWLKQMEKFKHVLSFQANKQLNSSSFIDCLVPKGISGFIDFYKENETKSGLHYDFDNFLVLEDDSSTPVPKTQEKFSVFYKDNENGKRGTQNFSEKYTVEFSERSTSLKSLDLLIDWQNHQRNLRYLANFSLFSLSFSLIYPLKEDFELAISLNEKNLDNLFFYPDFPKQASIDSRLGLYLNYTLMIDQEELKGKSNRLRLEFTRDQKSNMTGSDPLFVYLADLKRNYFSFSDIASDDIWDQNKECPSKEFVVLKRNQVCQINTCPSSFEPKKIGFTTFCLQCFSDLFFSDGFQCGQRCHEARSDCPQNCFIENAFEEPSCARPKNQESLCLDGSFFDSFQMACLDCPINCEKCQGVGQCVQCRSNFRNENGVCQCSGEDYFVSSDGSKCFICPEHCQECNETGCTLCDPTFILPEKGCDCPINQYLDETTQECLPRTIFGFLSNLHEEDYDDYVLVINNLPDEVSPEDIYSSLGSNSVYYKGKSVYSAFEGNSTLGTVLIKQNQVVVDQNGLVTICFTIELYYESNINGLHCVLDLIFKNNSKIIGLLPFFEEVAFESLDFELKPFSKSLPLSQELNNSLDNFQMVKMGSSSMMVLETIPLVGNEALTVFWNALEILQMIDIIKYIDINFPGTISFYYEFLDQYNFEVFEENYLPCLDDSQRLAYSDSEKIQNQANDFSNSKSGLKSHVEWLIFDCFRVAHDNTAPANFLADNKTQNFFFNSFSLILVTLMTGCWHCLIRVLYWAIQKSKRLSKKNKVVLFFKSKTFQMEFGTYIRLFLESIPVIALFSALQVRYFSFEFYIWTLFGGFLGFLGFLSTIFFLFYYNWRVRNVCERLLGTQDKKTKNFLKKKYGFLIEDFKKTPGLGIRKFFPIWNVARRIATGFSIGIISQWPLTCLAFQGLLSFATLVLTIVFRPQKKKTPLVFSIFSEIALIIFYILVGVFPFCDENQIEFNTDAREKWGLLIITWISVILIGNALMFFIEGFVSSIEKYVSFRRFLRKYCPCKMKLWRKKCKTPKQKTVEMGKIDSNIKANDPQGEKEETKKEAEEPKEKEGERRIERKPTRDLSTFFRGEDVRNYMSDIGETREWKVREFSFHDTLERENDQEEV